VVQEAHLAAQPVHVPPLPPIAQDQHHGPPAQHPAGVAAVELPQGFADPGAQVGAILFVGTGCSPRCGLMAICYCVARDLNSS
jgi:hypothetical protein